MPAPPDDMKGSHDGGAWLEEQRKMITPDRGFALVGIDRITDPRGELYEIRRFDAYRDALDAKKSKDRPEDYFVLYKDAEGACCSR